MITNDSQSQILGYVSGIIKNLGGHLLASGGASDHIHLLINAPTGLSLAELVGQIKTCSTKWYREKIGHHSTFGWNEGYSAFTVSPDTLENVKKYIIGDQERHTALSYQNELISFLKVLEIPFNPKFVANTTYTRLIYHLVWSVKNREGNLNTTLQAPLHMVLRLIIEKNCGKVYAIGNVADHIHLLVESGSKVSIADLVQALKTSATHLIKSHGNKPTNFSWQEGYGVFSVGRAALETVEQYVNNQENHHKIQTFEHEWEKLRGMWRPSGAHVLGGAYPGFAALQPGLTCLGPPGHCNR